MSPSAIAHSESVNSSGWSTNITCRLISLVITKDIDVQWLLLSSVRVHNVG